MGVFKQMMIDKMDELHGGDIEGVTEQDIIDAMVDDYMQSKEYAKEHLMQEKKVLKERLTDSKPSAII